MSEPEPIVAVALPTQRDLDAWGSALRTVYEVQNDKGFDELIQMIDDAYAQRVPPSPQG